MPIGYRAHMADVPSTTTSPAAPALLFGHLTAGEPGPPSPGRSRTGVVWVHGIGDQKPGDSLFDWTRPILDTFAEWRRDHDDHHPDDVVGENPVTAASVSDPDNRWIAVDIPAFRSRPRAEWLFTEAYWAGDVRPPSFSAAAAYLLGHLRMIIGGIATGYGLREPARNLRLQHLLDEHPGDPRLAELELALRGRWRITDALDKFWQNPIVRFGLMLVATPLAIVVLAVYAALHAIPIPAISSRVRIAAADTFIVGWFADLAVILDDQSQSAAVRTRLLERVNWLKRNGCDDVVLLAHSGGTIVSYATLLRYPDAEFPIAKLVTFGEAIKLGWHLEQEVGDWRPGNSVRGDLKAGHPQLRWVDVWASYDPAPSGPMHDEDGCPLIAVDKLSAVPAGDVIEVESRPVTNFMHLALDHGGYWSNDEGFIIPVIRHIDDARGNGDGARFFADALDRTLRTERRRRRVALLLAWRWTALGAVILSVVGLIASDITDAAATGGWVATAFGFLPGHEIVTGTIDGVGKVVAVILSAVGLGGFVRALTDAGPSILGGLVPLAAVWVMFSRGNRSWTAHDQLERRAIRSEHMGASGLASAHSEAALLVGGLAAIVIASTWGAAGASIGSVSMPAVAICLVLTAIVALALRYLGRRPPHTAAAARVAAMSGPPARS
jgi:hypothetical protein